MAACAVFQAVQVAQNLILNKAEQVPTLQPGWGTGHYIPL